MAVSSIKADTRIEKMVAAAAKAGMARDQVSRFVEAGVVILPSMMAFHAAAREADKEGGPDEIALAGSRGPGKSFTAMAQVGIDDCQRVPELKFLFLRKIMKSAAESMDDLVRKIFRFTPHEQTGDGVEFPNGSRILIGGYKDTRDIEKYLGIEYDGIVVEEATQLIEEKKEKIRGSMRTSKQNWRPRMYLTTNADGPGLQWFKKTYVMPWRNNQQTNTRFFQTSYLDNPFLNREYVEWLTKLKGALGKAWRDADWDAFAGMAFPTWSYDRHVVQPFEIPAHWTRWRAVDEGFAAPFCCLWAAREPSTRRIYVFREAYQAGLTLVNQARLIKEMTLPGENIIFTFADPAMWQKKNMSGKVYSAYDQYRDEGIILTRGDNDRIGGKRKIDTLLEDLPDGEPGFQVFDTCENLIDQMGSLARDEYNPEDVDTTQEDHAYDTAKYLLTNERKIQDQKPKPDARASRHPMAKVKGL